MNMKLDQKQMFHASQLFMAAGKAGLSFDMAVFVKDAQYASFTLDSLETHDDLKNMVAQARLVMQTALTDAASAAARDVAPPPATAPTATPAPAATIPVERKYVGGLR
jgi:hypothetical protein